MNDLLKIEQSEQGFVIAEEIIEESPPGPSYPSLNLDLF